MTTKRGFRPASRGMETRSCLFLFVVVWVSLIGCRSDTNERTARGGQRLRLAVRQPEPRTAQGLLLLAALPVALSGPLARPLPLLRKVTFFFFSFLPSCQINRLSPALFMPLGRATHRRLPSLFYNHFIKKKTP